MSAPTQPAAQPVQPYTISELLSIYDTCKGDWCAIARTVERYYITMLDAARATLAPVAAQQAAAKAPAAQAVDVREGELKPCPFCGAKAIVDYNFGRDPWVQCTNIETCGASDGHVWKTAEEAIAFWNRRAATPVSTPEASQQEGE